MGLGMTASTVDYLDGICLSNICWKEGMDASETGQEESRTGEKGRESVWLELEVRRDRG